MENLASTIFWGFGWKKSMIISIVDPFSLVRMLIWKSEVFQFISRTCNISYWLCCSLSIISHSLNSLGSISHIFKTEPLRFVFIGCGYGSWQDISPVNWLKLLCDGFQLQLRAGDCWRYSVFLSRKLQIKRSHRRTGYAVLGATC